MVGSIRFDAAWRPLNTVAIICLSMAATEVVLAQATSGSNELPDFSGSWFYGSATPFQRPEHLLDQASYTEDEALRIERGLVEQELANSASDPDRPPPPKGAAIGQEADHNFAPDRVRLTRIDGEPRTSLITSPTNGRLPYLPNGKDYYDRWLERGVGAFDDPEIRPAGERCLSVVGPMAPMIGWFYNANVRILQTDDYLVINGEMLPPRILRLMPGHEPVGETRWEGESLAEWEGDTLVVQTQNFRPEVSWFFFRSSERLSVTEKFRLASKDEIYYTYEAIDPLIYSAPIVVEMVLTRLPREKQIYEFACHEGNHSFSCHSAWR